MKNEPTQCCDACVKWTTENIELGLRYPVCQNPSCECHHSTLAQLSEEIEQSFKNRFRSADLFILHGDGIELRKWLLPALKKIATATYDAVNVEERELRGWEGALQTDVGWNAAKAEQDRNFTSFMEGI